MVNFTCLLPKTRKPIPVKFEVVSQPGKPHSEKRTYQDLSDFLMLCQAGDNLLSCVRVQPGSSLGAYGPETLPNGFRV